MSSRSTTILTVAGITVLGGFLAYAVYFDYKRRNDTEFRKKLRKEKKRVNKTIAQSKEAEESSNKASSAELREALEQIRREETPANPDEKEKYFMTHVGMGEQLAQQGPAFHLHAAMSFYRALRVYPSPVELIVIYQKTVPEPVFKLVMEMTNLDVQARVEGYYDMFPPKSFNVKVETRRDRKVLIATKDFKAGDVIYKEHPVVTVLDPDLQSARTHCAHCFRTLQSPMTIEVPEEANPLGFTFCSKVCLLKNKIQSYSLLFTTDSPLPTGLTPTVIPPSVIQERKEAQEKFVEYLKKERRNVPLLVARFIARQVAVETQKMAQGGKTPTPPDDFTDAENTEYLLADHIERLRYIDVPSPKEELSILIELLRTALPGLEQFVTEERHAILLGKMAYNAFGVCVGGGRDDRPVYNTRPEDMERTRTPYGTSRQIGSAFYTLSSYLAHSCAPSARPSFSSGTAELHLIATKDIKEGDELTVAYVDVAQRSDESVAECRRRRRYELARGWMLACGCERCASEAEPSPVTEDNKAEEQFSEKDGSKIEPSVTRLG